MFGLKDFLFLFKKLGFIILQVIRAFKNRGKTAIGFSLTVKVIRGNNTLKNIEGHEKENKLPELFSRDSHDENVGMHHFIFHVIYRLLIGRQILTETPLIFSSLMLHVMRKRGRSFPSSKKQVSFFIFKNHLQLPLRNQCLCASVTLWNCPVFAFFVTRTNGRRSFCIYLF